jgi:hypothetical protein
VLTCPRVPPLGGVAGVGVEEWGGRQLGG